MGYLVFLTALCLSLELSQETAGSFRIFPDSSALSELDYQYFSERIDFETFEDSILIGAADKLYKLDFDLNLEGELSWSADDTHIQSCKQEYSDESEVVRNINYLCRNHIRLYHRVPFQDDLLYMCGTQATVLPQCRSVNITNGLGEAGAPSDASSGLISAHPDYPNYGTFRNLTLTDNNFISWSHKTTSTFPFSFTEQDVRLNNSLTSNSKAFGTLSRWFDAPTYVVDMIYLSYDQTGFRFPNPAFNYDFYFVFLRERYQLALEGRLDTEPLILSRVVRICKDDPGVILDGSPVFSTLLKTRIYCDQESPGSNYNPLGAVNNRYNDIWSIALNGESGGRSYPSQNSYRIRKLYGAFSTPLTGPAGSAICIYAASASINSRNQNRGLYDTFVDDITLAANTDRTVENRYAHCDGNGRPVTDGTTLGAADTVVSRTMIQLGVNPLIVFDSIYITQMVVDEVCVLENNRSQCINQDILFLGTSLGTIRKVVFIGETSPIVAEEIVLENDNVINDLKIKMVDGVKYLFASTSSNVYRLSLERCGRHSTYIECVESRDPYCVWNATAYDCQQNTLTAVGELPNTDVPNNLFQNVHRGFIAGTPEVSLDMESYNFEEEEVVINVISNTTVSDGWVELVVLGDNDTSSGPYPVVFSGGLTAMVTVPFSDLSSADLTTSTVVMVFTIQLSNTDIGRVYFPRREASLRTVVKGARFPTSVLVTSITSSSATIQWMLTDPYIPSLPETFTVSYGTSSGQLNFITQEMTASPTSQTYSTQLNSLQPGIVYFYRIRSQNDFGTIFTEEMTFLTNEEKCSGNGVVTGLVVGIVAVVIAALIVITALTMILIRKKTPSPSQLSEVDMCTYDVVGGGHEIVKKQKQSTCTDEPHNTGGERIKLSQCPAYGPVTEVGGANVASTSHIM